MRLSACSTRIGLYTYKKSIFYFLAVMSAARLSTMPRPPGWMDGQRQQTKSLSRKAAARSRSGGRIADGVQPDPRPAFFLPALWATSSSGLLGGRCKVKNLLHGAAWLLLASLVRSQTSPCPTTQFTSNRLGACVCRRCCLCCQR